jgi:tRNA threonylcarbamoyladenosine biosynthesis protein TsaE
MLYWSTRTETQLAGKALGSLLSAGDVVALIGDLGTGKTTFTQGIAQGLGVVTPVNSPTFNLVQEHRGRLPLFHCDPYRLSSPDDLIDFGFEEYFERGGVVVVEWADKIESLLPADCLTLTLEIEPNTDPFAEEIPRRCRVVAGGERSASLKAKWEAMLS